MRYKPRLVGVVSAEQAECRIRRASVCFSENSMGCFAVRAAMMALSEAGFNKEEPAG
jgi:hypothetical protein